MRSGRSSSTRYMYCTLHIMLYSPVHMYCSFPFLHTVCLASFPCPSHYRLLMSMLPQYPVLETRLSPLLLTRATIGSSSCCYAMQQMLTSRTRREAHRYGLHQMVCTCGQSLSWFFARFFWKGVVHLVCS